MHWETYAWMYPSTSYKNFRKEPKTHCPAPVYKASFPTGIPIPFTPRSPSPRIRSPSVTTITWSNLRWPTKKA
eukprot:764576-Hanusia_phi.AAC.1